MVNTDRQFLDAIHGKITNKKRQWVTIFTSVIMVFSTIIVYETSGRITHERYELLWSEYQNENTEYYTWEVFDEIPDVDMYSYLLELYDMDEIMDILDDSPDILNALKTTRLEG